MCVQHVLFDLFITHVSGTHQKTLSQIVQLIGSVRPRLGKYGSPRVQMLYLNATAAMSLTQLPGTANDLLS